VENRDQMITSLRQKLSEKEQEINVRSMNRKENGRTILLL
jgi:hypothetical protein